jgi:hypothetical protein
MAGRGWNGNGNGIIEKRRRMVASLLARQPRISRRELQEQVGKKLVNPDTGNPFALGTIQNDIDALKTQNRERAGQQFSVWIGEQLLGLEELMTEAWHRGDLTIVLRCMQERAKLLGLNEPDRLVVDWQQEAREAGLNPSDVFERYVQAAAVALAANTETT